MSLLPSSLPPPPRISFWPIPPAHCQAPTARHREQTGSPKPQQQHKQQLRVPQQSQQEFLSSEPAEACELQWKWGLTLQWGRVRAVSAAPGFSSSIVVVWFLGASTTLALLHSWRRGDSEGCSCFLLERQSLGPGKQEAAQHLL